MADEESVGDSVNVGEKGVRHPDGWLRNIKFAKKHQRPSVLVQQDELPQEGAGHANDLAGPDVGGPALPSQTIPGNAPYATPYGEK